MNTQTTHTFAAASDLVIIGQNPEAADYSNPQGYIYGESHFVVATAAHGNRVRLSVNSQQTAEKMADALNVRMTVHGKLPVRFNEWQETRPEYGSDAYSSEDEIEWERSLEEQH